MMLRGKALAGSLAAIFAVTGAWADGVPADEDVAAAAGEAGKPGLLLVDYNEDGEKRFTVARGQVGLTEIAVGHVNRVITPFAEPQVRTSSAAEIQASGSVLYVQPKDESPVSLFITEAGNEDFAINVTLVPRAIPPVEFFLDLDDNLARVLAAAAAQKAAMTGQVPGAPQVASAPGMRSDPWLDRIKTVLATLAVGQVPPGLVETGPGRIPECLAGPGFRTDFQGAQWYHGQGFEAIVGRVTNSGPDGVFAEFWCAGDAVAAVALWPSAEMRAGAAAEILILRQLDGPGTRPVRTRPSLIGKK